MKDKLINWLGGITQANHGYVRFYYQGEIKKLEAKIAKLEADLVKAQRNDMPKDKKTGRFVKKVK